MATDTELALEAIIYDNNNFPLRGGWPDYTIFGELGSADENTLKAVVEVKPDDGRSEPRPDQWKVLVGLAAFGVPAFAWSPNGIVRVQRDGTRVSVTVEDFLSAIR